MEELKQFAEDVDRGLSASRKYMPSKYLYDDIGSRLFEKIMFLPEYYPTRCEYEILHLYRDHLLNIFINGASSFELIELGSGNGLKSKILLKHFIDSNVKFDYYPNDISPLALDHLKESLGSLSEAVSLKPLVGDYFSVFKNVPEKGKNNRAFLFLGSTIGNFDLNGASTFLGDLSKGMKKDDLLAIGFDLVKNPIIISNAYNDREGVTRAFNLNLLTRINSELSADFDISKFEHYPVYDPATGEARSYIVSEFDQKVSVDYLNKQFHFKAGECIWTEISRKYNIEETQELARSAGFEPVQDFFDCKGYFLTAVWRKK